ncbi:ABC transporter substrate-binding protein [Bradyrhizobium sp. AUGA SZCCT0283]|uniref:ABC transporter substrate-binding protein n=1 Tax=Bradyrhizobium sp. AUGA SZCCT0283 TaxID=2807671 RepID=UPI001BA5C2BE|nr:ABC transporter substrate-binding protein [Bradyrhizobium sp. AUGA SZCCT0283]MBR1279090.1 ABC transporter substrate-binding protein [Bradyrhizobium sp. AUGA SZCCT0283]
MWRRRVWSSACVIACAAALTISSARALDQVSLQLKWKHQFQFAGYYAAIEKGFYRDKGLEVELREGGPGLDAGAAVAAGAADFGVCSTSVLVDRAERANNVVLGVVFQHSAAVILVPYRAGIRTVSELKGHRLMDAPGSDDIAAMLKHEGVDYASLPRIDHDGNPRDLLSGKADAMVAYNTNETYALEKLGTPYLTFAPRSYGVDFYGDNLCTSKRQVAEHAERVRAFRAASLMGWEYALAHKDEIVDLISRKYVTQKSREALLFEAARTELLIQPHLTPIGDQSRERWQSIAKTYVDLGMTREGNLPEGLIYMPTDGGWRAWLHVALWTLLATILAFALVWVLYRNARAFGAMRLSAVMSGLFVLLSIPVLIFILVYNYRQNAAAINATLNDVVAKTKQASVEDAENLINPVAATLTLLATVAAQDPEAFRKEESRDLLYQALTSARQIDAAYVSLEDGYHRVVTRIDDDRRRSDPKIPSSANWHSSYIDSFSGSTRRVRHRTFFDIWPHVVGNYDVETTTDIRTLPGYQAAKEARALIVEAPSLNPDTGYPIISIRFPIIRDGTFIGCASANLTLDVLSRFLTSHRASPHSTTIIANPSNGTIIAAPDLRKALRTDNGRPELARLDTIADDDVREAYRLQSSSNNDDFLFRSPRSGEEISASFARFPGSFGSPWEVIILTPTADFVGTLERTNRQMIVLTAALTGIELLLIYVFSRRLSRPIEGVSQELRSVEDLTFSHSLSQSSNIKEIKALQTAVSLFETSLRSFSSFVPLDLVRQLIKTGTPLTLGVEPRFMTVLFSDLRDFSSLAEQMAPNELLAQLSVYFEAVSQAIAEESGTVDKFIGDGIMAFWGAPSHRDDHVLRACCGALRSARRMQQLNAEWKAQGRPQLHLRVGLHSANVLVGNVGSSSRLSYTVMGDGVNVASRLEGINKTFGTTICISDSVVEAIGPDIVARPIRKVQVKGRKHEFMIYELLGIRTNNDPDLKASSEVVRLCEMTRDASSYFDRGEFDVAARRYEDILRAFPDDPVARSLLAMCSANAPL